MKAVAAICCLALLALASVPSSADAVVTTKCRIGYYWPALDDNRFPTIHKLRATNLPRLTDGYAPRCLVAESVAGLVKDGVSRAARANGARFTFADALKRVKPMGARWSAGTYKVRYRLLPCDCDPYVQVTATQGRKRVTFQIGSV